jgi:CubicO group peptidase (beta-lactamase class C family)
LLHADTPGLRAGNRDNPCTAAVNVGPEATWSGQQSGFHFALPAMTKTNLHRRLAFLLLAGWPATALAQQVAAYHNVDGAGHQAQFTSLANRGYRMISLSIYGSASTPLYAAVWVLPRAGGAAWVSTHGVDSAGYQSFFNTWSAQGYQPKIITATGSGAGIRFACVFEKDSTPYWARHNISESQFHTECAIAREQGHALATVDIYGTSTTPIYAASWRRNDAGVDWGFAVSDANSYQLHFNAFAEAHCRPDFVGVSDGYRYVSVWHDDSIGAWAAYHGLDSATYQSTFNTLWNQGFYPLTLQGAGSGSGIRFAAVFVKTQTLTPRVLTTTGVSVPALSAFDDYVQDLMQRNNVRAASLAVAKDGRLMLARGYTWAEPGYPTTLPTSLFRIASASKSLTSIAIHQNLQRRPAAIAYLSRMLSFFPNISVLDSRTRNITVLELLTHMGGWDTNTLGLDPVFHDVAVGAAQNQALPIGKEPIFAYMTQKQGLQHIPGTYPAYSNYGFMMLGLILERLNVGMTYLGVMQRDVFAPVGLVRPRIGGSLKGQLAAGEVRYHPRFPAISQSVMSNGRPWVPVQYGGWNQQNLDSCGGWVMAAPDYAKVLAAFDLGNQNPLLDQTWTNNMWSTVTSQYPELLRGWWLSNVSTPKGTVAMRHHNGGLPGTATICARRADGLSFVLFFNRDHGLANTHAIQLSNLANKITDWPNHDLFPVNGIPGFRTRTVGTFTSYGTACAGSNGPPRLSGSGIPEIDEDCVFDLSGAARLTPVILLVGFNSTSLDLGGSGAPGCRLYAAPTLMLPGFASLLGNASIPLSLPNDRNLVGGHLYTQYLCVDPRANAAGASFSNGLDVLVGGWR